MNTILVTSALLTAFVGHGEPVPDKDLISLIRESHHNSRESIRTIHARLETVQTTVLKDPAIPPTESPSGKSKSPAFVGSPKAKNPGFRMDSEPLVRKIEWWQDGDEVRCTVEETRSLRPEEMGPEMLKRAKGGHPSLYSRTDSAIHAGVLTTIALQRRPDGTSVTNANVKYAKDTGSLPTEIWYDALFVLEAKPHLTFTELLIEPSRVIKIESRDRNGKREFQLIVQEPPPLKDYQLHILPRHETCSIQFWGIQARQSQDGG